MPHCHKPKPAQIGEEADRIRLETPDLSVARERLAQKFGEGLVTGEALLEFRIDETNDHQCTLHQAALFQSRGLPGLLYWYAGKPFHKVVFRGLLRGIAREAMRIAAAPDGPAENNIVTANGHPIWLS